MPTYQYRCKSCSYEFEELQKFSDEPLLTCPSCHNDTLVRVIGGAGLVFKGSGFYLTDYKKEGSEEKKPAAPKKKTAVSPETKSTEASPSETKPAEKTSSKSDSSSSSGESKSSS